MLRQAKENKITRLDEVKATEYFVPHAFLPYWDEMCLDSTLTTVGRLLDKVPVILLECRPDEEAVRLVHNMVF